MVTRYRAWMGEEALEDLDPSIIIIDISEDAGECSSPGSFGSPSR